MRIAWPRLTKRCASLEPLCALIHSAHSVRLVSLRPQSIVINSKKTDFRRSEWPKNDESAKRCWTGRLPGSHWTEEQIASLIHQVVSEGKALPQISIPGKSDAAINNQRRRLKHARVLGGVFVGRKLRLWTASELRELRKLTTEYRFSAAFISCLQLIPNRSEYAIGKMMGRHGLGSPTAKTQAAQARRLTKNERQEFRRFLRNEGRWLPSKQVSARWGVAQTTVATYRRQLGTQLSWREARSSQEYQESQQQHARRFTQQTKERWRQWREDRQEMFEKRTRELERHACPPPARICATCRHLWFATKEFYHVRTKHVGNRLKVTMSRTCRQCRSQQRRQKAAPITSEKPAPDPRALESFSPGLTASRSEV